MATFNVQPMPNNPGYQTIQPQQVSNPYGNFLFNGFSQTYNPNYFGKQQQNNSQNSFNLNQNQFLKCRPVSSKEEAMASQIDLDGSLWVFTDVGNGKIYTKQINNDGTATFKTYTWSKDEDPYTSTEFVTKNEFNRVIQSLLAAIQSPQQQTQQPSSSTENTVKEENKNQVPLNF